MTPSRHRAILAARALMEAAGTRKIPPQEWTETDVEIAADCIETGRAFPESERQLTYLACPYAHPDPAVRLARVNAVNRAAAALISQGELILSPLSHARSIADAGDLPHGWDFWERIDRAFLACCRKLIVLKLDGWEESVGVRAEIAIAEEMGLAVEWMECSVRNLGVILPAGDTEGERLLRGWESCDRRGR